MTSVEQSGFDTARLRTPRAAAVAGILFGLLLGTSYVLVRVAIPSDPAAGDDWIDDNADTVRVALGLIPFAGIAFLWFMGVVRDRIGRREDQFFSTVFLGSGLLFVGLMFVSGAIASAVLAGHVVGGDPATDGELYRFGRDLMYRVTNTYALRMAAVFMISLATIWIRTRTMPRWLPIVTYAIAAVLLVTISFTLWIALVFPAWVVLTSVAILLADMRRTTTAPDDA